MNVFRGFDAIPELQGLSKLKQRRLWREAQQTAIRRPLFWVVHAVLMAVILIGALIMISVDALLFNRPLAVGWMLGWTLLGMGIYSHLLLRVIRPLLARQRAAKDPAAPAEDGSYHVPPAF